MCEISRWIFITSAAVGLDTATNRIPSFLNKGCRWPHPPSLVSRASGSALIALPSHIILDLHNSQTSRDRIRGSDLAVARARRGSSYNV